MFTNDDTTNKELKARKLSENPKKCNKEKLNIFRE
jgi:hypothetical protein